MVNSSPIQRAASLLGALALAMLATQAAAASYVYKQPAPGLVASAVPAAPAAPSGESASCTLPWGGTLASGATTTAYVAEKVAAPGTCVSETLSCTNGALSDPTAAQSCVVTDPSWGNVSALLEFDGSLSDATGTTVTPTGVAKLSSSVFKVGTGSLDLSTGGYVSEPAGALNFGTGDFTVEFWHKRVTDNGSYQHLILNNAPDGSLFQVVYGNSGFGSQLMVYAGAAASPLLVSGVTKTSSGTAWHHYAVTRSSGTLNVYFDGARVAQRVGATENLTSANAWVVGSSAGYNPYGYFDGLRVTKGYARYTGTTMTPADAPFPRD